jgi:ABC-type antimicrobial peptide transport system permease subunit
MVTERMLGFTKRESVLSMLFGLLLFSGMGVLCGTFLAIVMESNIINNILTLNAIQFDRTFSIGVLPETYINIGQVSMPIYYSLIAGVILFVISGFIALLFTHLGLKREIMQVRSMEEE